MSKKLQGRTNIKKWELLIHEDVWVPLIFVTPQLSPFSMHIKSVYMINYNNNINLWCQFYYHQLIHNMDSAHYFSTQLKFLEVTKNPPHEIIWDCWFQWWNNHNLMFLFKVRNTADTNKIIHRRCNQGCHQSKYSASYIWQEFES